MLITCLAEAVVTNGITQDGILAELGDARTMGQYVDGSWWVVAPDGNPVTFVRALVEPGTEGEMEAGVTCLYIGRSMIDPGAGDLTKQGFDNRLALNSRGPGMTYQADQGVSFPFSAAAYPSGKPKTVWLYRGRDQVVNGSESSGCWSISQITLVSAPPAANAIKPTGLYVAAGKTTYTTADVNYSKYTPRAFPSGAVEPNWASNDYLLRPISKFGTTVNSSFIAPNKTQLTYPADQCTALGRMLLGMLSVSTSRNELINRVVRDGQDVKALADLGSTAYVANGGFGVGGKPLWFFARQFLGQSWTLPPQVSYAANMQDCFQEDGTAFIGAVDGTYPSGKPLWGANGQGYPSGPWPTNHITRDVNGLREPHWMNHHTGTVAAATSTTVTLDAAAIAAKVSAGWAAVSTVHPVYTTGGVGPNQNRSISAWVEATKVATVPAWDTIPNSTTTYEYSNGGQYQTLVMPGHVLTAMAVVLAGEVANWNKSAFFGLTKRWVGENGCLTPRTPATTNMATNARDAAKWGDINGNWGKLWWNTYCTAIWPA